MIKVGDSFDEARKKRLHELARLRSGGPPAEPSKSAVAAPRSVPTASTPVAKPAVARVRFCGCKELPLENLNACLDVLAV